MRFIQYTGDGLLELNYMWLPTWLGMNAAFKKTCERALSEKFKGRTTEDLDDLQEEFLDFVIEKYPLPGLRDYLDGIKFVEG